MTSESLGERVAIGIRAVSEGIETVDLFKLKLANGKSVIIMVTDAKHEPLFRQAIADLS